MISHHNNIPASKKSNPIHPLLDHPYYSIAINCVVYLQFSDAPYHIVGHIPNSSQFYHSISTLISQHIIIYRNRIVDPSPIPRYWWIPHFSMLSPCVHGSITMVSWFTPQVFHGFSENLRNIQGGSPGVFQRTKGRHANTGHRAPRVMAFLSQRPGPGFLDGKITQLL